MSDLASSVYLEGGIQVAWYTCKPRGCRHTYQSPRAACRCNTALQACNTLLDAMHATIGHVNVYDLYAPCVMATEFGQVARAPIGEQSHSLERVIAAGLGGPDGCIDAGAATKYLDNSIVQTALNVAVAKKSWHAFSWILLSRIMVFNPHRRLPL